MILHGPEAWFFWVLALFALIGGLFTVLSRSAVHSAMCLMLTLISTAGLFLLMHAEFVMGVQILVYRRSAGLVPLCHNTRQRSRGRR
jgi:NADH:ubiquinone oxidoreductase subunit 6 (subunit J)